MDFNYCKPCYGLSCPLWPTCFPEMQTDIKELDGKIGQLQAENKKQAAWLKVQQKELDSTRDFEIKVLGQIEQLEAENKRLKEALENIKTNETRVMKGFGEVFNNKKRFKGKSASYILADQALQEKPDADK